MEVRLRKRWRNRSKKRWGKWEGEGEEEDVRLG